MTFIIAEIAQAHNGSLGMAHAYVDAVAKTGCDAIKFQTHIAEAESSIHEPFRVQFSTQDSTRMAYWKRMEFSLDQWKEIKAHCDDVGLEFMSSPFSNAAVDLLEEVGVKRYKVGSGEVSNFVLLERIAQTKKPIIISSGMSSLSELDATIDFLKKRKVQYSILQCTTAYPTIPEQYGLNMISELKHRYETTIGFSDHSSEVATCIAARTLGAEILEFHTVFDKEMFGPDVTSSLTMKQTKELVQSIRNLDIAFQHPVKKDNTENFDHLKAIFEKSLAINKDLKKGHIINFSDLETKKPKGYGISANQYETILGKRLNKDLDKWSFLNENDITKE
ncbi:N-acetylneuraminate synthase family protein [Flavobacteriaceae bacterium S356]|uniref:N-acetylneuraminate synthase family protein n=1 Tax=Asprobacillus argus TaxID=3076534 RepID=A0ABU3LED4_9FLAO|nr:N-acetylneuraminate synthase family protein [Flavobacteriaceae bacterium S356]